MYVQKFPLYASLKKVDIYDVVPNEKTVLQIIIVVIIYESVITQEMMSVSPVLQQGTW